MTVKEVQSLFNNAKRVRDTLILRFMYLSLRVGDVLRLRYENIDFEESTALCTVKGGKNIIIVIDTDTMNLLRMYCQEKGIKRGPIFTITRQRVHQIIKDLATDAGLERAKLLSSHKLRHSFAVHSLDGKHLFIKNRLNLRQVQLQMGHSKIQTTSQYLQYTTTDRKEAFGFG